MNKENINKFRETKKPSKKEILKIIENYIDKDNSTKDYEFLIAKLLDHFYVKPTKKALSSDPILWTLQAVSKDEKRYNLLNARYEDNNLIAVDGRRLHIAKGIKGDENTLLTPQMATIDNTNNRHCVFPRYKQVIPDRKDWQKWNIEETEIFQWNQKSHIKIKHEDKFISFNLELYNQLMAFQDTTTKTYTDSHKRLIIESDKHFGLLMAVRTDFND